jgi:hypothetical protein
VGTQVQHTLAVGTRGTGFRHFLASNCGTMLASTKSAHTFAPLTAALVKADAETRFDPIPQIGAAPADNTVLFGIRTVLNPAFQFAHLRRRQAGLSTGTHLVNQASHAVRVVAVHPVSQGLAVHATRLSRQLPRMIIQHHRDRQHPPRLPRVLRSRRLGPKLASGQVVTGDFEQSRRLPRESTIPRIDSQSAAFENP